jgi:hypothetical protein
VDAAEVVLAAVVDVVFRWRTVPPPPPDGRGAPPPPRGDFPPAPTVVELAGAGCKYYKRRQNINPMHIIIQLLSAQETLAIYRIIKMTQIVLKTTKFYSRTSSFLKLFQLSDRFTCISCKIPKSVNLP